MKTAQQKRHNIQMEQVTASGREQITNRLLREQHAWSTEIIAAMKKRVCARSLDT